jgi:hypothetical protein
MNSNLQKALATSMMMLGLAAPVLAQLNFDDVCTDPNNTAPYSAPFGAPALTTPLWIAGMGFYEKKKREKTKKKEG